LSPDQYLTSEQGLISDGDQKGFMAQAPMLQNGLYLVKLRIFGHDDKELDEDQFHAESDLIEGFFQEYFTNMPFYKLVGVPTTPSPKWIEDALKQSEKKFTNTRVYTVGINNNADFQSALE